MSKPGSRPAEDTNLMRAGIGIGAAWVVSRAIMAYMWWYSSQYIINDVTYYFTQMSNPNSSALVEYPTPILWLMRIIHVVSQGNYGVFVDLVVGLMVVLDALVTVALFWRSSPIAAGLWVVFLALLGPIMWFRIDMIPAACVTLGLLFLTSRPTTGGALLAVGAATKIWPALLILPALGRNATARARTIGFAVTGAAMALVSLVLNGWTRSVSPITWQDERGLQIESLSATWAMVMHAAKAGAAHVFMSPYHAYEVTGQGVAGGEIVAHWLMVAAIAYVIVMALLLVAMPAIRREDDVTTSPAGNYALLLTATATITAMIAANKTFSPQYLIWLAGPLGLVLAGAKTPADRKLAWLAAIIGCVIAGLTQTIFPLNYNGLLQNPQGAAGITSILVIRNVLMAVLTLLFMVWAGRSAWRVARPLRSI